ncbi:collagen alpha-1(I) chain-like [Anabrus simplex]|uniref:collagen alpha-1(I) chain-like n=1 Tax=Anabrus simplex TaxID=316456 RepID=UPI0035A3394C
MARIILLCVVIWSMLAALATAEDSSKWVWGASGRNNGGYYPDERFESRPISNYRPPPPVHETSDYNPPEFIPGRPGPPPGYRPGPPQGAVRPPFPGAGGPNGPGGPGILTGPIPSWEQGKEHPHAYKHYDRCKCAFSFNCNSPGISFGSCDEGKQYCCYQEKKGNQGFGSGRPPYGSGGPDILVGPGGHRDLPGPNILVGPPGDRDGPRPDILVGPGGPTGVLFAGSNRPYGQYGNGGDYDDFYYGRSNSDKRKGDKKY